MIEIEAVAFPEKLNRVLWLQIDGTRYYNTEYAYGAEDIKVCHFSEKGNDSA